MERHPFCVVIGRCFSKTHPTILIGRQCPFVRAKVDPGAPPGAGSGRPAANAQACDLAVGLVGVRLLARRTLRGRGGRSCCCQLVRELRPEASYPSRPLPAPQTQGEAARGGVGWGRGTALAASLPPGPGRRGGAGPGRRYGRWIAGPRGPTPRRALRSLLPGRTQRDAWEEPAGARLGRLGAARGPRWWERMHCSRSYLSARVNPPPPPPESWDWVSGVVVHA